MASENNTESSIESFRFEDTSYFDRLIERSSANDSTKNKQSSKTPSTDLDTSCIARIASLDSFDYLAVKRQKNEVDSKMSSFPKVPKVRKTPTKMKSTGNISTLSSFDLLYNTQRDNSRSSFFKSSRPSLTNISSIERFYDDSSMSRYKSSGSSSGYLSSMETLKSSDKEPGNLDRSLTRKLSQTTSSLSDRSLSLPATGFLQPLADSTHLGSLDYTFRCQDGNFSYEPKIQELKLRKGSVRRLDMLKIVKSPKKTIKVVLKIRSITPDKANNVQVELVCHKEIIPANFKGVSSLVMQLTAMSLGRVVIEMVVCSTCSDYSSRFIIKVEVINQ